MFNKKLIANAILQFSIVFIIISLFYFEKLNFNKINFIFSSGFFYIVILLVISKIYISILFYFILKILSGKRNFYKIMKIYLLGGLANEAVPGLGYIYRYQKFKNELKLSIVKYGISQSLNNILILFSYLLIALSFISFEVELGGKSNLFLITAFLLFLIFFLAYKHRLNILYFARLQRIYKDLSNVKKNFLKNKFKFLLIFFLYFLQSLLQCYIFYKTVLMFEFEISFINTSYLYISSILSTFLSLTNFIGAFELVLSLTSSFIVDNYIDMWSVGFGFRIMGLISLMMIILVFYFYDLIKNKTI